MGRATVLCLAILSLLMAPGLAGAIQISGSVWATGAEEYALAPSKAFGQYLPTPNATFTTESINFDSRNLPAEQQKIITFNQFLNSPAWDKASFVNFDPDKSMFAASKGVFFQFTWSLDLPAGSSQVNITHDDGFFFFDVSGFKAGEDGVFKEPKVSSFDVMVKDPGKYNVTLNYGALNNTDTHVLIFSTPEPGSMLLLALGIIGIGVLRRRH